MPIDDRTEWLEADGLSGFASATTSASARAGLEFPHRPGLVWENCSPDDTSAARTAAHSSATKAVDAPLNPAPSLPSAAGVCGGLLNRRLRRFGQIDFAGALTHHPRSSWRQTSLTSRPIGRNTSMMCLTECAPLSCH